MGGATALPQFALGGPWQPVSTIRDIALAILVMLNQRRDPVLYVVASQC